MNLMSHHRIWSACPVLILVLFAFWLVPRQAFGQGEGPVKLPAPNQERGFSAPGAFQETVNLFSGNVNIAIPIATLESSNEFVFQLTLQYNSNVWQVWNSQNIPDQVPRSSDLLNNPRNTFDGLDPSAGGYAWNVAPGWMLHPGRIVEVDPDQSEGAHFIYFGPDRSQVPLYRKLHSTEPVQANTFFSRDGSYLRFHSENGPTGTLTAPNGIKTKFVAGWFAEVEDAFGNKIDKYMDFPADPTDPVVMVFEENRYGRKIRVGLTPNWIPCGASNCFNPDLGLVEWVEYPAPGVDANGNPNVARIDFGFVLDQYLEGPSPVQAPDFCDAESPNWDPVACGQWVQDLLEPDVIPPDFCDFLNPNYDHDACFRWRLDQNPDAEFAIWRRHLAARPPLADCFLGSCLWNLDDLTLSAGGLLVTHKGPLNRITFPDGSEYRFKYGAMSEVDGGPAGMMSGAISEMRLPNGGTFTYIYGEHRVPDNRRDDLRYGDGFDDQNFWGPQMGVIAKHFYDVGKDPAIDAPDEVYRYRRGVVDANNVGASNYLDQGVVVQSGETSRRRDMFVVETNPLGHETVHYYRTPEKAWDYGLPFTRHVPLHNAFPSRGEGDIRQAYLSQEFFTGAAVVNGQKGNLKRQAFVTFERDVKSAAESFSSKLNARLHYRRELFWDDLDLNNNPHYREQIKTDFDGYGNYRTVTLGGSFLGGVSRSITTNYNPDVGKYAVFESDAGGDSSATFKFGTDHNFSARELAAPWFLEAFDFIHKFEDGVEGREEFHFDLAEGKLKRKRILANFFDPVLTPKQNRSPNDVLFTFSQGLQGEIQMVRQYGGDVQNNLPTDDLKDLDLTLLEPEYQKRYRNDYANGVFEVYVQDPKNGADLVRTQHLKIEKHTGLVIKTKTTDEVTTTIGYDASLREITRKRGLDTKVETNYTIAHGSNPTTILVSQGNKKSATTLDGLGREVIAARLYPSRSGDDWSYVEQVFQNGTLVKQSHPFYGDQTPTYVAYLDHDFAGRPTRIRMADGTEQVVVYKGSRLIRTFSDVAAEIDGTLTPTAKEEVFDPLGRLTQVRLQLQNNNFHTTTYTYDVNDNLVQVTSGIVAPIQTRKFIYDNRGFLIAEDHPELDNTTGLPDVVYSQIDTSGNPGEAQWQNVTLRYRYHHTEELIRVSEILPGGTERILKDFAYADNNLTATNKNGGKLWQARRYNYLPNEPLPVIVTKTYLHEDANGRLSTVRMRTDNGQSFEQTFHYDDIGQMVTWKYPAKKIGSTDDQLASQLFGAEAQRTITFSYARGFLVNVPAFLDSIRYHPHQAFAGKIVHNNGVTESITQAHGMERPHRIEFTSGPSKLWDSGFFTYDPQGNVSAIGLDRYAYDHASRLIQANVAGRSQTYAYDKFGNMTHADDAPLGVDHLTNRLGAPAVYDPRGNLVQFQGSNYLFDAANTLARVSDGVNTEKFIYDAFDHRVASLRPAGPEFWTIKDEKGRVLKEYKRENKDNRLKKVREYIYSDRLLGAFYTPSGTGPAERRHYHLDHMGSPRLITDESGTVISFHQFLPFGEEVTVPSQEADPERQKFTGQERDSQVRDYFKARYYLPLNARFFSPDPVRGLPQIPQSWNRYSYALNNPIKFTDPTGEMFELIIPAFSEILSEIILIDPVSRSYAEGLEKLDTLLAAADQGLEEFAVQNAGNDALALTAITIDEFLPDSAAGAVFEIGVTATTGGLGKAGGQLLKKGTSGKVVGEAAEVLISKGRFGHTFRDHGQNATEFVTKRAAGSGKPSGQFLDDKVAARFIADNLDKLKNGAISLPIPDGFPARVIMPDGSFATPTTIRLVPSGNGVKTAYPEL